MMNARFNAIRWLTVVVMGVTLGLLYVSWRVSLIHPGVGEGRRSAAQQFSMAPVKLSEASVRKELIQVIESQLSAFRKNDYPKAYHYAAASVQEQMPLPAFERMVRTGFPVIARSSSAEFGVTVDNGEEALVNVGIISEAGKTIRYQYFLKHERAGWKINGVTRIRFEGTNV
ncbi:MAG: hypothetical protein JWR19_4057 [Pedosphaera sp.]|nr:hypothetical protein [Pedosphaera sp.]